jgi:hypothetical protein
MTYAYLESDEVFARFIQAFEEGTLPRSHWTHAAHLAVGTWYLMSYREKMAAEKVRAGIRHYNECAGIANTLDSGYHETLTLFWLGMIKTQVCDLMGTNRRLAALRVVEEFGTKRDLFKEYYSFDVVASPEARAHWIPPDRIIGSGGNKSTLIDI